MAFSVRPVFKNRSALRNLQSTINEIQFDNEENQRVLTIVRNFSQKSSHPTLLNPEELKDTLRRSSVNPEYNPHLKTNIETMIREKEASETNNLGDSLTALENIHGFSSASTARVARQNMDRRLKEQLQRELDESRPVRMNNIDEQSEDDNSDKQPVDQTPDESNNNQDQSSSSSGVSQHAEARLRHQLQCAFPPRASLARQAQLRTSALLGTSMRRTPLGVADAL